MIDLILGDADRAVFEVPLEVVRDPSNGIDYRDPFTQGRRGQRFSYLSWGDLDATSNFSMFRRVKLNLFNLPEHVEQALVEVCTVDAEFDLSNARGEPICQNSGFTIISIKPIH